MVPPRALLSVAGLRSRFRAGADRYSRRRGEQGPCDDALTVAGRAVEGSGRVSYGCGTNTTSSTARATLPYRPAWSTSDMGPRGNSAGSSCSARRRSDWTARPIGVSAGMPIPGAVDRTVKQAADVARIGKRVTCHTHVMAKPGLGVHSPLECVAAREIPQSATKKPRSRHNATAGLSESGGGRNDAFPSPRTMDRLDRGSRWLQSTYAQLVIGRISTANGSHVGHQMYG